MWLSVTWMYPSVWPSCSCGRGSMTILVRYILTGLYCKLSLIWKEHNIYEIIAWRGSGSHHVGIVFHISPLRGYRHSFDVRCSHLGVVLQHIRARRLEFTEILELLPRWRRRVRTSVGGRRRSWGQSCPCPPCSGRRPRCPRPHPATCSTERDSQQGFVTNNQDNDNN